MRVRTPDALEPYLARLREIPFVRGARLSVRQPRDGQKQLDGIVLLETPAGKHELVVELRRTYLTYATAEGVLGQMQAVEPKPWILFAPYIPRPLGQYLADQNTNFLDLAGNCRLILGQRYMAIVEGRTPKRALEAYRGLRVPGYQVLFAILAEPGLLNTTVRQLATAAGTGKTAAAETIRRLQKENLIGQAKGRRFLLETKVLLERWISGYATHVRPRLLAGVYRTVDQNPEALEHRVENALGATLRWAFGGGAAAERLVHHYRGERTVVHVERVPPDLPKRLGALKAEEGPLVLLRTPGRVAFDGLKPRTVHPLLIYTELLALGEPRAREAAIEIWDRHLVHLR